MILLLFHFFSNVTCFADVPLVLIFGKTIKPAHTEIIPVAGHALENYFAANGFKATFTNNPNDLTRKSLKNIHALVFLDTSERVLNSQQKRAVQSFYKNKGGIMAIHASIAMGNDWPWFQKLIGASFRDHPPIQPGNVVASETSWTQNDEWYRFKNKIDPELSVIATVSAGNITQPISWLRETKSHERFWYTAMGHECSLYLDSQSPFMMHVLDGLRWTSLVN